MSNRQNIESIIREKGFLDFKWIDPKAIVVSHWVRMKCIFGCPDFGQNASCPPNTPSVKECRKFFDEYNNTVIFHFARQFEDPEDRNKWTKNITMKLLKLEKDVFLKGNVKAFLLPMDNCQICKECTSDLKDCNHPKQSRPTPEALAVDVYTTVKKVGYPIEVLTNYNDTMNRYAFLLID